MPLFLFSSPLKSLSVSLYEREMLSFPLYQRGIKGDLKTSKGLNSSIV